MRLSLSLLLTMFVVSSAPAAPPEWQAGGTVKADGLTITLSKPRLVARSAGFLWFPTLLPAGDKGWQAVMSNYADVANDVPTALVARSEDGGLTWGEPKAGAYGECGVPLAGGDMALLPYYMKFRDADKLTGPSQLLKRGETAWQPTKAGVAVTGWPREVGPLDADMGGKAEWNLGGFVFNGQAVTAADGKTHLATLYGRFAKSKRYSLVIAESPDAAGWKIRAVIADDKCKLKGNEGPCESAVVRLKDGRLLCVFRLDSGVPYGHSFSSDDGKTWAEPTAVDGPKSVQPSLALSGNGVLALSGGRPGLTLWLNRAGDAKQWGEIDLAAHHSACVPAEPIRKAEVSNTADTSAYTEVRWLDATHFLVIYDRLAAGWKALPAGSKESNSVWVVRGTVE